MAFLGELAALGTSFCWSFTATFFTLSGRMVGSVIVNRTRLVLGVCFLAISHWILFGTPLPADAQPDRWFWFILSGVVGLVVGDAFLFQSYLWIGPQVSMLVMNLVPVLSTLMAWVFLGEILQPEQVFGILITVAGISWVVLERKGTRSVPQARDYRKGLLFAAGAALGQALGLIAAKKGLAGDFSPLSGTLMRMMAAMTVMWTWTLVRGQVGTTLSRLGEQRQAFWYIIGGSFFGPFLGVTLSLVAIQGTEVGVASTLMALPPVLLLPISRFIFGEAIGWRPVLGTLVTMVGVAVLLLL